MKAIPTAYRGTNYRSRLEARWAAFFDLCEWDAEYEPVDFQGWIPDFALLGERDVVYVEVKPIVYFCPNTREKIDRSGCKDEVLLLGMTVAIKDSEAEGHPSCFGWLREMGEMHEGAGWWMPAAFGRWAGSDSQLKNPGGRYGFCSAWGSFGDRITGCYDGGCWGGGDMDPELKLQEIWRESGNLTQWKPRR